jgi:hypothetical protein
MEKVEVQRTVEFLSDVYEGICEGDATITMQQQLTELYRVIRSLMDATSATEDQDLKVLLASLEYRARRYNRRVKNGWECGVELAEQ